MANFFVELLHLPIRLGVIPQCKADIVTEVVAKCLPDLGDELCSPVRYYVLWDAIHSEHLVE